jgi:hypothetical protein
MGKNSNEGKKYKRKAASVTANKVGRKKKPYAARGNSKGNKGTILCSNEGERRMKKLRQKYSNVGGRGMKMLRQNNSNQVVMNRCAVCMKNFASEYYLNLHYRKVRCKKTIPTLASGIEYIAVDNENFNNVFVSQDPPEMLSSNINTYIRVINVFYVLILIIWCFLPKNVLYTYIGIVDIRCYEYLEQQMKWKACNTANNVPMGFCKGESNKRLHGLYRDYIDLSAVIEDAGISELHATNFLTTMKTITHRHGINISIPTEYRNLKRAVLKQVVDRLLPIKCELIPYPKSMFDCSDTMKRMPLVHVDLMLVVADIMLHVAKTGIYVIIHVY